MADIVLTHKPTGIKMLLIGKDYGKMIAFYQKIQYLFSKQTNCVEEKSN